VTFRAFDYNIGPPDREAGHVVVERRGQNVGERQHARRGTLAETIRESRRRKTTHRDPQRRRPHSETEKTKFHRSMAPEPEKDVFSSYVADGNQVVAPKIPTLSRFKLIVRDSGRLFPR
jgi:hypothetical protein